MSGLTHEEKLKEMNWAFSPFPVRLTLITQADGLGWYKGAPLALSFAGAIGRFPARIAMRLGVRPIHAIALGSVASLQIHGVRSRTLDRC